MNGIYALEISHEKSPQARWLKQLESITMPGELGQLIVDYAEGHAECAAATLLWDVVDIIKPDDHDGRVQNAWIRGVADSGIPQYAPARQEVVFRLCEEPRATLLLLTLQQGCEAAAFIALLNPILQLAGRRLRRLLMWVDQRHSRIELERSERLQRALFSIAEAASSDRALSEVFRCIHSAIGTLIYAENLSIVLHDELNESIRYIYHVDVAEPNIPGDGEGIPLSSIERSLAWHLVTQGRAMVGTIAEIRDLVTGPLTVVGPHWADCLGVPMVRDGRVQGAVVVQSYKDDTNYSDEDMALLKFVSGHIQATLERKLGKEEIGHQVLMRTRELAEANRELYGQLEELEHAEHLQGALYQIAKLATVDIKQEEFYRRVHSVIGQFLNAKNSFIALISECGQRLDFPYAIDKTEKPLVSKPLARTLSEYTIRQGRPLLGDAATIQHLVDSGEIDPWVDRPFPTHWLSVPLVVDGRSIGLLAVWGYNGDVLYTEADRDLLGFVALQIAYSLDRRQSVTSLQRRVEERTRELGAEILERKRIQEQLSHQIMHDMLTGLPNRRYLRDRVERVQDALHPERQRLYALLYLDIDRFKSINDSLGHLAGDEVLKTVANHLWSCLSHPDLAVRLSGDEFAVLLETASAPATAIQVAQRIMDRFDEPMMISGKAVQVSVSIGCVIGDAHYQTVDQLLHDADVALYRAKRLGRRRFELFDVAMAEDTIDVLAMEIELRRALQENQFEPYFQPIRRLDDDVVMGYEALIRWNHPERGVLEPAHFLKVATDCNLIEAIDWRMFELSFESFAQHVHDEAFVTFNVSALHLGYEDFDARLISLLGRFGLAPERVIVEITEEVLLNNPDAVRIMLTRLQSVGVGTALDDFGTGYSSLHYLHTLPLRMLKIDRAFVNDLDKPWEMSSSTVVAAILALARALDIQVIAEGIEMQSQRDALIAMNCQLGQGYLLGRPCPASGGLPLKTDKAEIDQ
ncbi:EAL domain-containing protein [Rhodanobacter sp. Col0626]|uniref:EAL domain-containing protein n=1 Tax=Rhodanobacter sp. Col0626 TaxID=3415679 RepID=UPI003CF8369F